MNTKLTARTFVYGLLLIPCVALAQQEADSVKLRMLESIAKLPPLHVYGRVIDQYGAAVPGVRIRVSWTEVRIPPDPGQTKWIEADADGEWKITINKPGRVSVRDLEKEGYEFDRKASAYFAAPNREELIRRTSKDNPLVMTMRKKGDATFLIHNKGRVDFVPPGGVQRIDLLEKKSLRGKVSPSKADTSPWDISVEATFSEESQQWDYIITSSHESQQGVFVSDGALYKAPAENYKGEHRESVGLKDFRKNLSLCVRSRTSVIYSRVNLEFSSGKERCIVSYDAWVNPYGSRNLEYNTDLNEEWRLRRQLEENTKLLVKQGKQPEQPDLKALIKAEKEKEK